MKWGDIKIAALQRMFAINGDEIIEDDTTLPYLKAMPGAANEALQLLSTAGKYILKSIEFTQDGNAVGPVVKYPLKELCPDYYSLAERQVFFNDGHRYGPTAEFSLEGTGILVLPAARAGVYTVYYNAYPAPITAETADSQELPLDPEAAALIPLYIASQLYKDDDMGQAVQFRNEFEAGRELLLYSAMSSGGREYFQSEWGLY